MNNPEFGHNPENRFSLPGITPVEQRLLQGLTPENIQTIKQLNVGNLSKIKHKIVGVRSEDIFFLLESIQQGYLSTSGAPAIMTKSDPTHFYLTENPESEYIVSRYGPSDGQAGFSKVASTNVNLYANIAMRQAINRNILSLLPDQKRREFIKSASKKFGWPSSGSAAVEDYFDGLIGELGVNPGVLEFKSPHRTRLHYLYEYIKPYLSSPGQLDGLLRSINSRRGVVVGFSNELVGQYKDVSELADGYEELVLEVPEGKIDSKYIVGFETLGEFEDGVIEGLEQR